MSKQFSVGDVVELKSGGGVPMTVEGYVDGASPPIVGCVWREKSKVYRDNFLEATLDKFEPMAPIVVG